MTKRIFYVHIRNHVDRRDDDFYKVRATSKEAVKRDAEFRKGGNTRSVGGVYTPEEFRQNHGWWTKFLRKDKPRDI
jgi:hypothetical protein